MPPPSSPDDDAAPLLSVVIPVFNEVATIERVVAAVQRVAIDLEIIIVDDHSTDGTRDQLERMAAVDDSLRVCCHPQNHGKGAALRTGFAVARGRFVVIQDADLEYNPSDYSALLAPLVEDRADVVFGSRFLENASRQLPFSWHTFGNKCLTKLSNLCSDLNLTDMETCYKMFRREILDGISLRENRFGFEPEFVAEIAAFRRHGRPLRVTEVAVSYQGRKYRDGKKINWRDGLRALWCIVRYNLLR